MPPMVMIEKKDDYDPFCIPKPENFVFDDAADEMNIMVKVHKDGDDKLRITEIEGEEVSAPILENENEMDVPLIPEME